MVTSHRASAVLGFAAAAIGALSLALTVAPSAHADPLAGVRQAVVTARNGSTCPALNYSIALEGDAQNDSGNLLPGVPPPGQYHGTSVRFSDQGDPAASAINALVATGPFTTAIDDCGFTDFGVGFWRFSDIDYVSVVLGKPATPPAAPPAPAVPPAPNNPPAPNLPPAVKIQQGDVDIYAQPGGVGTPLGFLREGTEVHVLERRPDNWVHVEEFILNKVIDGWVWGDYVPPT